MPSDSLTQYLTPAQRVAEWREAIDLAQDDDWPNVLAHACELAAEKGLTIGQKVSSQHGQPVTLYGFLYGWLKKKGVEADEAKEGLMDALDDAGVEKGNTVEARGKPPHVVYVPGQGWFTQDPEGTYSRKTEQLLRDLLEHCGLSDKRVEGCQSEVGRFRAETAQSANAVWAGELAGWPVGVHTMDGRRVLVPRTYRLIAPAKGDWCLIKHILGQTLGPEQLPYFLAVLARFYRCLQGADSQSGQMMVLCGPPDAWKSYIQHRIITPVWGGRSADAARYLTNKTEFNADLAAAEHLYLDDSKPYGNWLSRHDFAENLKNLIVGKLFPLHDKYRTQIHLPVRQRVTMSLNDDETALRSMPDISSSFADKVHLFHCRAHADPLPNTTPEERQTLDALVAEQLPAFIHDLLAEPIPEGIVGQRFGVKAYHNPELLASLDELSDERKLLDLVDGALLPPTDDADAIHRAEESGLKGLVWAGRAVDLQSHLCDSPQVGKRAAKLLSWDNATGTLLGRLATKHPERVQAWRRKINGSDTRLWLVSLPDERTETEQN